MYSDWMRICKILIIASCAMQLVLYWSTPGRIRPYLVVDGRVLLLIWTIAIIEWILALVQLCKSRNNNAYEPMSSDWMRICKILIIASCAMQMVLYWSTPGRIRPYLVVDGLIWLLIWIIASCAIPQILHWTPPGTNRHYSVSAYSTGSNAVLYGSTPDRIRSWLTDVIVLLIIQQRLPEYNGY